MGEEVLFLARVPLVKRERLEKIAAVRVDLLRRPHGLERLERNDVLLFLIESYGEIAVMRIDGSDVRMLTDNSVEEGVPVWIPRAGQ